MVLEKMTGEEDVMTEGSVELKKRDRRNIDAVQAWNQEVLCVCAYVGVSPS